MSADPTHAVSETLPEALRRHNVVLPEDQVELLDRYARLLWDWNEKLNLTRHTNFEKFVARDLIDCLALEKELGPRERVLDVGTGGGVPGIVLAIIRPDLRVALSESVGKKAKVAADIVRRLGLAITVNACRAEDVLAQKRFDTLTVRAVAKLDKLLGWFKPFWGSFERLLIIKGPAWIEERGEARQAGRLKNLEFRKLAEWPLPGTESASVLLQIRAKDVD